MKITEFTYSGKNRQLYVLRESEKYIEGVDISHLEEDDKKAFKAIVDDFWEKIEPFTKKAYRKFEVAKSESLLASAEF